VNPPASRPAGAPDLAVEAPAKLNLFLEVIGKRADGFHEIETVMQAIDLCDRVEFWKRAPGKFSMSSSGIAVPLDEDNLVMRAARLMADAFAGNSGAHLHLEKRIPIGGGLGGGSSDAAAVLRGLDRLWQLDADLPDLERLGSRIGSDVNFFLYGGLALCRGRGELVEPLTAYSPVRYVLHVPQVQSLTKDIYARLRMPLTAGRRACTSICEALERGNAGAVGCELFNRLEEPAFELYPDLADAKAALAEAGALGSLLSGSGSTVYAAAAPEAAAGLVAALEPRLGTGSMAVAGPVSRWR